MSLVLDPARVDEITTQQAALTKDGVPQDLAIAISMLDDLAAALDIVRIAEATKMQVVDMARLYFAVGARLGLDWLRAAAARIKVETPWQKRAVEAVYDDLFSQQGEIARRAVEGAKTAANGALTAWTERNQANLARVDGLLGELKASPVIDLAALTVVGRELRGLTSH
jgi:glutamate dehydrogenase